MQSSVIGKIVTVTVDRPMGSYHPEHKDMYYPVNYGYIEGIIAPDGEEQDAYILGVDKAVDKFTGKIIDWSLNVVIEVSVLHTEATILNGNFFISSLAM